MMFLSHDFLHLTSKLTLKRILNAVKVGFSFYWSKISGSVRMNGMPVSLAIEPTTSCNLRCPECPSGLRSFTRPIGKINLELFKSIIDELSPTTTYLTFYFQGEPFLHPDFLKMVKYANEQKMYTATSTNAHFLDQNQARKTVKSGLSKLIISIDGVTQETYESYRKAGNLNKVLEATKNILEARTELESKTPAVIWQFLVVGPNEHEIPELKKLAKEYKVDKLVLKTAQIYDFENGSELIPRNNDYSRYKLNPSGKWEIKNNLENQCWKMWHSCVITWDGNVVPCCFDKDAHHIMGTTLSESFETIWTSNSYQQFRKSILRGRSQIEICKNCTEGTNVWA